MSNITTPNPASSLAPKYDPATVEAEVFKAWTDEKCFAADPNAPGEPYCIVIPPPNVTGALHLGHAINATLQDILIRTHRMKGFNTLWIPGIDHAGIATQAVVEKQLKENENKTRHDVGREGLVERIWAWKQQYGDRIISQLKRIGASCDWDRTRFTLDDMCAKAVRETFFKMFKDGLVFRGKRLVNWDIHLQTSISDDELYTETVKTNLWSIKYPIDGTDRFMTVATTRPETMLADTAVAVHPDDPRWNWAIGKSVRLPLTNRLIPIIGDPILVDMAFGSGCVKVTPAHDPNDYGVWERQGGGIAILNLMTPDGKVNDADASWSAYTGMRFNDARKKIVEDLIAGGFMNAETDIKPHEANVSFSDRSKTAVQPYLSDQWFVRMADLAEPALEVVRNGTIKFHPERHAQQYLAWLGEKRDWPISRQLWWGHRIPVWSFSIASDVAAKEALAFIEGLVKSGRAATWNYGDTNSLFVCIRSETDRDAADYIEARGFTQDPDVLDTWFSSGLWPHSTLGWPEQTPELAKWYPGNVLLTGRDIITLWVARMVMMGMYNMGSGSDQNRACHGRLARDDGEAGSPAASPRGTTLTHGGGTAPSALQADHGRDARDTHGPGSGHPGSEERANAKALGIPFFHVAINPTILDGKGERMSKTKGNGVDPVDIIDTHGADALRFTLATMATETQDVRLPVKKDGQGRNSSEKFDLGRNFCTKLWNAARFAISQIQAAEALVASSAETPPTTVAFSQLSLPDRWILSRLAATLEELDYALATYRFDAYAKSIYDFLWRDFCDWYLESIKPAMKDSARASQTAGVLAAVLDAALRVLHPVVPYITEEIWGKLNLVRADRSIPGLIKLSPSHRLVRAAWPAALARDESTEQAFSRLQDVIGGIRNIRNEHKVEPKRSVVVSLVPPPLSGDPSGQAARVLADNRELIELFGTCTVKDVSATLSPPPDAARSNINGCEVFIEGVIDPDAEANRLAKRREDLIKQAATLEGRLASPAYTDKAPAHLVDQTRTQLADVRAELEKLG